MEFRVPYKHEEDKLQKLLESFIPFTMIPEMLPKDIRQTLKKRVKFDGGLILNPVNPKDSSNFYSDLAGRIYQLRNAIVHSKRLVDERKGRVTYTPEDMQRIDRESNIVRYFAIDILSRTALIKSFQCNFESKFD